MVWLRITDNDMVNSKYIAVISRRKYEGTVLMSTGERLVVGEKYIKDLETFMETADVYVDD